MSVEAHFAHDMQYGPQAALIAEAFTPRLRYSGASLSYQLASVMLARRHSSRLPCSRAITRATLSQSAVVSISGHSDDAQLHYWPAHLHGI